MSKQSSFPELEVSTSTTFIDVTDGTTPKNRKIKVSNLISSQLSNPSNFKAAATSLVSDELEKRVSNIEFNKYKNDTSDVLKAKLDKVDHTFDKLISHPTTVQGYGITDAYNTGNANRTDTDWTAKDFIGNKLKLGKSTLEYDEENDAFKVNGSIYATGGISCCGTGPNIPSGGGLIENVYNSTQLGNTYNDNTLTDTFNAFTIASIHKRVKKIEDTPVSPILTFNTTGSGNVITSVTRVGDIVTSDKGVEAWTKTNLNPSDYLKVNSIADWAKQANKPSYSISEIGDNNTLVRTNDSRLNDSRNAKDVYTWAKSPNKPSYGFNEIGDGSVWHSGNFNPLDENIWRTRGLLTAGTNFNNLTNSGAYDNIVGSYDNNAPHGWSKFLNFNNGIYGQQLSFPLHSNPAESVKYRNRNGDGWGQWITFWDSQNSNKSDVDWNCSILTAHGGGVNTPINIPNYRPNSPFLASNWESSNWLGLGSGGAGNIARLGVTSQDHNGWLDNTPIELMLSNTRKVLHSDNYTIDNKAYASDWTKGVLVKTGIKGHYSTMCTVTIKGNSYYNEMPIDSVLQFYTYNPSSLILSSKLLNNGFSITGLKIFLYNDYYYIWFPIQGGYHTYQMRLIATREGQTAGDTNFIESITDSEIPSSGVTKLVDVSQVTSFTQANSNKSDVEWNCKNLNMPYSGSISSEWGNILRTEYEFSIGDTFVLEARGNNPLVGTLIGSNTGTLTWNGQSLYHTGNFNPANYLPKTEFTFDNISGKPTTIEGYGITNGAIRDWEQKPTDLNNRSKNFDGTRTGYQWTNSPIEGIASLKNTYYSDDWVDQEYTLMQSVPRKYLRNFINGTTWSPWYEFWHTGNFNPSNYLPLSGGTITDTLTVNNGITAPSIKLGSWEIVANGNSLSFKLNGVEKGTMTDSGFVSSGGITALN